MRPFIWHSKYSSSYFLSDHNTAWRLLPTSTNRAILRLSGSFRNSSFRLFARSPLEGLPEEVASEEVTGGFAYSEVVRVGLSKRLNAAAKTLNEGDDGFGVPRRYRLCGGSLIYGAKGSLIKKALFR
uniref:Uncharacterized protein n=1 Tax=Steinernema glaseri TaxID=37863 RepID=A0A1I8A359_9BILA